MKVYLATRWVDKALAAAVAEQFEAAGHTITKRWWEHREVPDYLTHPTGPNDAELEQQAIEDFDGVVEADAFVLINSGKSEGKAVEMGIALTMCHRVIVVGQRSNIFHYLPEIEFAETTEDVLRMLQ